MPFKRQSATDLRVPYVVDPLHPCVAAHVGQRGWQVKLQGNKPVKAAQAVS